MEQKHKDAIAHEFRDCVNRTIERVKATDTYRPFHKSLLSTEVLFWSRFERSFSTSFGQRVMEKVPEIAVLANGASQACTQKVTNASLSDKAISAIDGHVQALRERKLGRAPSWETDLADVRSASTGGSAQSVRVISDLWWEKDGVNNYLSIKTVKPNIDQSAEAKRDLLKLKLADPNCNVYFGLYYNPFGEDQEAYNWKPPQGIFNFNTDPVVLIGEKYWDTLGGKGFYKELLEICSDVGEETRKTINEQLSPGN